MRRKIAGVAILAAVAVFAALATACSKRTDLAPASTASTAPAVGATSSAAPTATATAGASPSPSLNSADRTLVRELQDAAAALPKGMANGNKLGSDAAPIKMIEFEDFQCPFCLRYTAGQEPTLIAEYVKTGKLQITYASFPILGAESVAAAEAAQCAADQNAFWQYHNLLFLTQARAGQSSREQRDIGRFSDANLKQFASTLGLDRTTFDSCYDSGKYQQLIVDQYNQARRYGLPGTPGFVINGTPIGTGTPATVDGWRKAFDQILAGA